MTVGNPVVQLWYLLLDTTAHYPDEFLSQQIPFIAIFSSILSFLSFKELHVKQWLKMTR